MAANSKELPPPPLPPAPKAYKFVPKLPVPTSWTEEELRDKVLQPTIPTAVADAGASSNCGAAPLVSACGDYEIADSPFLRTGKESDRTFRDVSGGFNSATDMLKGVANGRAASRKPCAHGAGVQRQPAEYRQVC